MSALLRPEPFAPESCPVETDPAEIAARFSDLLGDESRVRAPSAKGIFLPRTPAEAAGALAELRARGWRAVLSSGRTGITGAAAPLEADAVVSFAAMDRIFEIGREAGGGFVRAGPGVTLKALAERLRHPLPEDAPGPELWMPVDPTEQTAQLGGAVAANASGARTYRHGALRSWVRALEILLADGRLLRLRRGEVRADGLRFLLSGVDGREAPVILPEIPRPTTKCTAGYFAEPGMDAVDLFIGSEGTLGAIVGVELRLVPRPASCVGVVAFPPGEAQALELAEAARRHPSLPVEAIEYFDEDTLRLLREKKEEDGAASPLPDLPAARGPALYLELAGTEEETEAACEVVEELLQAVGADPGLSWAAMGPEEMERQKAFRHAAPETVNARIGARARTCPGLHKVGTDMAVPDAALCEMFSIYRRGLAGAGLESVIFGHLGNNHVHVNLLPRDLDGLARAKALYLDWAREAVRLGGAVAAEHGIGRLKRKMLELQHPPAALEAMRELRRVFDPAGLLSPGVLL